MLYIPRSSEGRVIFRSFSYRTLIVLHDFDFLSPMCMYFYCNGFVNPNNELDGYNCYDIQLLLLMFAVVIQLWN